jgi:hypothetical protein
MFNGSVDFGTNLQVTINRNGILTNNHYITLTLPSVMTPIQTTPIYCMSFVTLLINAIKEANVYNIYNNIYNLLFA